jgi:hypothetical protein
MQGRFGRQIQLGRRRHIVYHFHQPDNRYRYHRQPARHKRQLVGRGSVKQLYI